MEHRQLQTTPYVLEHLWSHLDTHSYLSSVFPPMQYTKLLCETTAWPWTRRGSFLVSLHFIFLQWNEYYWKHTSDSVAHSCVKSRISSWTDKIMYILVEFILRVKTHDRVKGLVGLQVFASDGEQQVFRFTQTEQASRAGHRWHCLPITSNTVQLDRTK